MYELCPVKISLVTNDNIKSLAENVLESLAKIADIKTNNCKISNPKFKKNNHHWTTDNFSYISPWGMFKHITNYLKVFWCRLQSRKVDMVKNRKLLGIWLHIMLKPWLLLQGTCLWICVGPMCNRTIVRYVLKWHIVSQ